jgi:peptidoglycan-associated lipoprotein
MRRNLIVPAALLILAVSGCAKQPATMPASATTPSPGSTAAGGAGALGRQQSGSSQQATTQGATVPRPVTARTDSSGRPSPRDFSVNDAVRDIYFDFDKYDIRSADQKTLDANAAWLKSNARALLLIEGHCDERGTPEYNLALGERRAQAAMSYLVALGIQANRISIVSYGQQQPLCTERTEACWAKNRRAHFLVKSE